MKFVVTILRSAWFKPVRWIARGTASRWPWPVGVPMGPDTVLFVDLRSSIGRGLFVRGDFDPVVRICMETLLRRGDTVVDVGANIGFYTVRAAYCVGEEGEVHAFEVDPRALRCLLRTQRTNDFPQIVVHALALGERPGVTALTVTEEMGHTRKTLRRSSGTRYPVLPLDVWLPYFDQHPPRLIKVDVEGAELEVLRGGTRVIQSHNPYVLCEMVQEHLANFGHRSEELFEFMESHGYTAHSLASHSGEVLFSPAQA